jgi:hypothetical protein
MARSIDTSVPVSAYWLTTGISPYSMLGGT